MASQSVEMHGIENMIHLTNLSDESILENLHIRYRDKGDSQFNMYTYVGSILIAVNPYRPVNIYTHEHMKAYRGKRLGDLPPHIFALADAAYTGMLFERENKCCIISGESGAGKTETAKHVLGYLAKMSEIVQVEGSGIEQQVVQTDTILESFGCAVTERNDNSSRFGKYFDVKFDINGNIRGASVDTYMLELSRVTKQAQRERNYHVFYRLLNGATTKEKDSLSLATPQEFTHLNSQEVDSSRSVHQESEWRALRLAMQTLLFTEQEQFNAFTVIAGILHLGNVEFSARLADNIETSTIVQNSSFKMLPDLLGFSHEILREAFTIRTTYARGESLAVPQGIADAKTSRDTLAKDLYKRTFSWIASKINSVLGGRRLKNWRSIGVLDIYGFEILDTNSFEQLCINFWNEHLQQYFVQHIFKMEQELYISEGIGWQEINFIDNHLTLALLSEHPLSIFAVIDDVVKLSDNDDSGLLRRLHNNHAAHPHYIKPKVASDLYFGIRHFAGNVVYAVSGFVAKNRDSFSSDLQNAVVMSTNPFIVELYSSSNESDGTRTRKRNTSLARQFTQSLKVLLSRLNACGPLFVRCIKPNTLKKPNLIDSPLVLEQLRYCGVLATVEIRRAGFSVQRTYSDFTRKYRVLLLGFIQVDHDHTDRELAQMICAHYLASAPKNEFAFGNTKIFLKDDINAQLEEFLNNKIDASVRTLQRCLRGALVRSEFAEKKEATRILRERFRIYAMRSHYRDVYKGDPVPKNSSLFQESGALSQSAILPMRYNQSTDQQQGSLAWLAQNVHSRVHYNRIARSESNYSDRSDSQLDSLNLQTRKELLMRRKANLKMLKHQVGGLADMLNASIAFESSNGPTFQDYAKSNFSVPSKAGCADVIPAHPILANTRSLDTHAQQKAVSAWTLLFFMTNLLDLQGTTFRPKHVPKKEKQKRFSFRKTQTPSTEMQTANAAVVFHDLHCSLSPTQLEMCQSFIGLSIDQPQLTDELCCQVVDRFLNCNEESDGIVCLHILGLLLGCSSPSKSLAGPLSNFFRQQPQSKLIEFCHSQLKQWFSAPSRIHPPSNSEFQAAKVGFNPDINIALSDGTSSSMIVRSRVTTKSICMRICEDLGIYDSVGWALFLISQNTVCLNSSYEYVLDCLYDLNAVSSSTTVTLSFQREYFPPWYQPQFDTIASELEYYQVVNMVSTDSRFAKTIPRTADLLARRCYVTHGLVDDVEKIKGYISSWISAELSKALSLAEWSTLVHQRLSSARFSIEQMSTGAVMISVSRIALRLFPMLFARHVNGITLHGNSAKGLNFAMVDIALTQDSITASESVGRIVLKIPLFTVISVIPEERMVASENVQGIRINCFDADYFLSGSKSSFVLDYLTRTLTGLRNVSTIGVMLRDSAITSQGNLHYEEGDIIVFEKAAATLSNRTLVQNLRTGEMGFAPVVDTFVLATSVPPNSLATNVIQMSSSAIQQADAQLQIGT